MSRLRRQEDIIAPAGQDLGNAVSDQPAPLRLRRDLQLFGPISPYQQVETNVVLFTAAFFPC